MIGQDVLLGRQARAVRTPMASAPKPGARFVRILLNTIFVSVIVFESGSSDSVLDLGTYLHRGIGSWSGLPIILTPLELLILFTLPISAIASARLPRLHDVSGLAWPMALFVVALGAGLVRGAMAGGDLYVALWELRYLLYVPACFFIARTSLRRAAHVTSLLRLGLVGAALFAVEGAYRKVFLVNTGILAVPSEFAFEHDDVIFLAVFLILVFAALVFRMPRVRLLGLSVAPVLLFTLLASGRRSGVIVLLVGLMLVALTLFVVKRGAFFAAALPVLVGTGLYLALFWNAGGVAGQPARAIRSIYEPNSRDAASNLYRVIETYDINATIHDDPLLGVGFGRQFLMVATLPSLSWWPFWRFETHNNVLWLWMKLGVAGYLAFWVLIGTGVARATYGVRCLRDPGLRAVALVCSAALVGVVVFGYVDLAFVSGRTTVFLGTVLGILSVIERIDGVELSGTALVAADAK